MQALKVYAGSEALTHIQKNGLQAEDIRVMLAASGGPKWFANYAMDRYLVGEWFKDRRTPLHLLGTSAGAFRMACYAQNNPTAALDRFLEAYLSQQYSAKPTAAEIANELERMVVEILQQQGAAEIIANPVMKFNTLVARCKGWAAKEHKAPQSLAMLAAMLANAVSPAAMSPLIERVLFYTSEQLPIAYYPNLPVHRVELTERSIAPTICATGSIPLVIKGVDHIPDAPAGMYRDGGVTDYQFDLPVKPNNGLVLYPHYSAEPPKGGWFDKGLKWRKAQKQHYSHTIILAPSNEFAYSLPGGKIPERQDFYTIPDYTTRRWHWEKSLGQLQQLGDELAAIAQQNKWAEVVEPLPW